MQRWRSNVVSVFLTR